MRAQEPAVLGAGGLAAAIQQVFEHAGGDRAVQRESVRGSDRPSLGENDGNAISDRQVAQAVEIGDVDQRGTVAHGARSLDLEPIRRRIVGFKYGLQPQKPVQSLIAAIDDEPVRRIGRAVGQVDEPAIDDPGEQP